MKFSSFLIFTSLCHDEYKYNEVLVIVGYEIDHVSLNGVISEF
jgi:hypothetical protein